MSETIDRLMDAAEAGMRQRGYHAVSFRDLADELGIKSASVHYYFRQKEDLGLALVERYANRFFDTLMNEVAGAETETARIAAFCKVYRSALTGDERICLCGMLGSESRGLPEKLSQAVAGFFEANIKWLANAMSSNRPLRERRRRATQIVAALQGAMMLAGSLGDYKLFDQVVREVTERQPIG